MGKFFNEYEQIAYLMFKASGGNPYLVQEVVEERNKIREMARERKGREL